LYASVPYHNNVILLQIVLINPSLFSCLMLLHVVSLLTWTKPHDNNAPITGYYITYQNPDCLVMAPNNQPQDVTVTSMEEQAVITDLHPGENYSFIVIAINDICPSIPSIPVSARRKVYVKDSNCCDIS